MLGSICSPAAAVCILLESFLGTFVAHWWFLDGDSITLETDSVKYGQD